MSMDVYGPASAVSNGSRAPGARGDQRKSPSQGETPDKLVSWPLAVTMLDAVGSHWTPEYVWTVKKPPEVRVSEIDTSATKVWLLNRRWGTKPCICAELQVQPRCAIKIDYEGESCVQTRDSMDRSAFGLLLNRGIRIHWKGRLLTMFHNHSLVQSMYLPSGASYPILEISHAEDDTIIQDLWNTFLEELRARILDWNDEKLLEGIIHVNDEELVRDISTKPVILPRPGMIYLKGYRIDDDQSRNLKVFGLHLVDATIEKDRRGNFRVQWDTLMKTANKILDEAKGKIHVDRRLQKPKSPRLQLPPTSVLLPVESAGRTFGTLFSQPSLLKKLFDVFNLHNWSPDGGLENNGFVALLDVEDKEALLQAKLFDGWEKEVVPPLVYLFYENSGFGVTQILTNKLLDENNTPDIAAPGSLGPVLESRLEKDRVRSDKISGALKLLVDAEVNVDFRKSGLIPIPYSMVVNKESSHVVNLMFSDEEIYIAVCLYIPDVFIASQAHIRDAFHFLKFLQRERQSTSFPMPELLAKSWKRHAEESREQPRKRARYDMQPQPSEETGPYDLLLRAVLVYLIECHESHGRQFLVRAEESEWTDGCTTVYMSVLHSYLPDAPQETTRFAEVRLIDQKGTGKKAEFRTLLVGSFDPVGEINSRERIRKEENLDAYVKFFADRILRQNSDRRSVVDMYKWCVGGKIEQRRFPLDSMRDFAWEPNVVGGRVRQWQSHQALHGVEGDYPEYQRWVLVEWVEAGFVDEWTSCCGSIGQRFCSTRQSTEEEDLDLEDDTIGDATARPTVKRETEEIPMYEVLRGGSTILFFDELHKGRIFYHGLCVHYESLPFGVNCNTLKFGQSPERSSNTVERRNNFLMQPSLTEAVKSLLDELRGGSRKCRGRFVKHLAQTAPPSGGENFGYGHVGPLQPFISFVDSFMLAKVSQTLREHSVQERLSQILKRYSEENRCIPVLTRAEADLCQSLSKIEDLESWKVWKVAPYLFTLAEHARVTVRWRAVDQLIGSFTVASGRNSMSAMERSLRRILCDLRIANEEDKFALHYYEAPFFYALQNGSVHHVNINPKYDFMDIVTAVMLSQPMGKSFRVNYAVHMTSFFKKPLVWDARGNIEGCKIHVCSQDALETLEKNDSMTSSSESKVLVLEGHTDRPTALAFNARGSLLGSVGWDGRLCLWSTQSGELLATVDHKWRLWCLAWADASDGLEEEIIALGDSAGSAHIYTLTERISMPQKRCVLENLEGPVLSIAFAESSRAVMASCSAAGTVRIWVRSQVSKLAYHCDAILLGHTGPVWTLQWRTLGSSVTSMSAEDAYPDEVRTLLSGGADGTVRSWQVAADFSAMSWPVAADLIPHRESPKPLWHESTRVVSHCTSIWCPTEVGRVVRLRVVDPERTARLLVLVQTNSRDEIVELDISDALKFSVTRAPKRLRDKILDFDMAGGDETKPLCAGLNRLKKGLFQECGGKWRRTETAEGTPCVLKVHQPTSLVAVALNNEYEGAVKENSLSVMEAMLAAEIHCSRADVQPRHVDETKLEEGEMRDFDDSWAMENITSEEDCATECKRGGDSADCSYISKMDVERKLIRDLRALRDAEVAFGNGTRPIRPWEDDNLKDPELFGLGEKEFHSEMQRILDEETSKPLIQNFWGSKVETMKAAAELTPHNEPAHTNNSSTRGVRPQSVSLNTSC